MPFRKPCPVCGSVDIDDDIENRLDGVPMGNRCLRCGLIGPDLTERNWKWDDRTPGPATKDVLLFASSVIKTDTWSQDSRKMFKAFLEEWNYDL